MRLITIVALCLCACSQPNNSSDAVKLPIVVDTVDIQETDNYPEIIDSLELALRQLGLVDVQLLNPNIVVDLKYSSDSNFLGQNIYGDLSRAYLEENTAKKLALAQYRLSKTHPHLSIKVWDAARPVSCQRKMWYSLNMPAEEKGRFVSNPRNHSLHNYGCAVDVTLVDSNKEELDLGSYFDQFDSIAQPKYERHFRETGVLSNDQLTNRFILRKTMKEAGFSSISSEWWHFNACTRQYAKENYQVIQ